MRRGTNISSEKPMGRAKTLDLSQSPPKRQTPFVPSINVRDTVFEEDETQAMAKESDHMISPEEHTVQKSPLQKSNQSKYFGRQDAINQEDIPLKPLSRTESR